LGLDSLTALELGNRLEASLGVTLSPTLMWNYPTIGALAPYLASKMNISLSPTEEAAPDLQDEVAMRAMVSSEVARLSDDEAEAMLLQELSRMDELQARSMTARENSDE
jgi:hypothetical protein